MFRTLYFEMQVIINNVIKPETIIKKENHEKAALDTDCVYRGGFSRYE